MKRILLITVTVILCLSLSGCFSFIKEMAKEDAERDKEFHSYFPDTYSGKDLYSYGVRDFTVFNHYFYDSDISEWLLETGYYAEVGDDNRDAILSRVQLVEEIMDGAGDISQFDFDYTSVTADDLYAINKNNGLFYYDKEKDILYYVRQDF